MDLNRADAKSLQVELDSLATREADLAPEEEARLAWLAVRLDELAHHRRGQALPALARRWEELPVELSGPLDEVEPLLAGLEDRWFLSACVLFLWTECQRLRRCPPDRRPDGAARRLIELLSERRLAKYLTVDRFFSPSLLAWMVLELSTVLPHLDPTALLRGVGDAEKLLLRLGEALAAQPDLKPGGSLWPALERWAREGHHHTLPESAVPPLAALLARAGEQGRLEALLESIDQPFRRATSRKAAAEALFSAGREQEALSLADRADDRIDLLHEEVGRRLAAGDRLGARRIAQVVPEPAYRARELARVGWAAIEAGEWRDGLVNLEAALDLVEEAEGSDCPEALLDGLSAAVQALAAAGPVDKRDRDKTSVLASLLDRAEALLDGFREDQERRAVQAQLAGLWAALGETDRAWQVADGLDGLERLEALSALAEGWAAWGGEGDELEAILLTAEEVARSLPLKGAMYAGLLAVAHAWAQVEDEEATRAFYTALATFKDAVDAGRLLSGRYGVDQASQLIFCLASTRPFPGRSQVAREVLEVTAELGQGWWRAEALEEAPVLLELLGEEEVPDFVHRFFELAAVIEGPEEQGKALQSLAEGLVRRGLVDPALDCLGRIAGAEERSRRSAALGAALCAGRSPKVGERFFRLAVETARQVAPERADHAMAGVVQRLIEGGRLDQAWREAWVLTGDHRSLACSSLAYARLRSGQGQAGREDLLLGLAPAGASGASAAAVVDPAALGVMAKSLSRLGESDGLAELFTTSLARSRQLESPDAQAALELDLLRLLTAGAPFPGREERVDDLLADLGRQDETLEEAAQVLLAAGRTDRALAILESLGSARSQGWVLTEAARLESRHGNQEMACDLLRKALAVLEPIEPATGGYAAQLMLLPALCELEDGEASLALAYDAISQIRHVESDCDRADCLSRFGETLAQLHPGLWAVEVFDVLHTRIEEAEIGGLLLRQLQQHAVAALARAGRFREALERAKAIGNHDQRSYGVCDVLRELARAGRRDEVVGKWALILQALGWPAIALTAVLDGLDAGCPAEERAGWRAWFLERLEEVEVPEERARLLARLVTLLPAEGADEADREAVKRRLERLSRELFRASDAEARESMLQALVETWAHLGEVEQAADFLDQVDAGDLAVPAIESLSRIVAGQEGLPRAHIFATLRSLAASCDSAPQRASARATVARAMAEVGQGQEAVDLLMAAAEDLEIGAAEVTSKLLAGLAQVLGSVAALDGARRVFDRLLILAGGLPSSDDQREAFTSVAGALVDLHDLHGIEAALDLDSVGGEVRCRFVTSWRAVLLVRAEPPLPALRYTLRCFAAEPNLGTAGAQCLAAALLEAERDEHYRSVVERCPELGFPRLAGVE